MPTYEHLYMSGLHLTSKVDCMQAMMLAYCRKKVVEGVMADKNNWRARLQKRVCSCHMHMHMTPPAHAYLPLAACHVHTAFLPAFPPTWSGWKQYFL